MNGDERKDEMTAEEVTAVYIIEYVNSALYCELDSMIWAP